MNKSEKSISLGFNLNPFQIKSTSVSRYINIEECRLKGALNAKGETKLLAYSIDHVFGDLIHKLMENSLYDDFPKNEKEVTKLFEEKINKEEQKLENDDLLRPFLPLNRTRDFVLKKKKAIKNALSQNSSPENTLLIRRQGSGQSSQENVNRTFGPELKLNIIDEASKIKIKGSIDKVSKNDQNQIVITDYKSGEVLDNDGKLKKSYKDQLEIYAAIYQKQFGKNPYLLIVENLKEKKEVWNFDENTSMKLYKSFIQQIIELNELLRSKKDDELNELLCETSESGCKFCPYKPKCKKFINRIQYMTREELVEEKNIYGKFIKTSFDANSSVNTIEIESNDESFSIRIKENDKHPDFNNLSSGTKVGFFNLRINNGKFVEKKSTRSYFYE